MMKKTNLHLSDEEISEYADGLLANHLEQIDKRIINHLSECATCREKVFRLADVIGEYEVFQQKEHKKRYFLVELLAAAAILIAGTLWISFSGLHKENDISSELSKAQRLECFAENNFLEELTGQKLGSDYFRLLSPKLNALIKTNIIHFEWKTKIQRLKLSILDNSGKKLFEKKVRTNSIDVKNSFSPGLYYWKLETEDNLIFVGKFKINA